jgi:hypothetical protein
MGKRLEKGNTPTQLDRSPSSKNKAAAPSEPNNWQAVHDSTNPLRLRFQRTSQQHTITQESSSPAPATSWKLFGQRMAEALGFAHQDINLYIPYPAD